MGFNNPSEIAVRQLTQLYGPSAYAATVISLGTGVRSSFPYSRPPAPVNVFVTPKFQFSFNKHGILGLASVYRDVSGSGQSMSECSWVCLSTGTVQCKLELRCGLH